LQHHYPDRASRVLKALASMRHDKLNDSTFGTRFEGVGPRAAIIRQRFELACRKAGISTSRRERSLDCSRFSPPSHWRSLRSRKLQSPAAEAATLPETQMSLF